MLPNGNERNITYGAKQVNDLMPFLYFLISEFNTKSN